MKVLVTGATGYIGGRLVPRLLNLGYQVRATSRSLEKLKARSWANHENLEIVASNALEEDQVKQVVDDCTHIYYLIHSMNPSNKDFAQADRIAAQNIVNAADESNIQQIIYLGGLGKRDSKISKHLQSRNEVAKILRSGKTPFTILRAAMIIGSGSASFEILRYLVERLPFMLTPKWVRTKSQPIAIANVLTYLLDSLGKEQMLNEAFDIGGPDIINYEELIQLYAKVANLKKRIILPVPVLTPKLSSHWIRYTTPIPSSIVRPLVEGLENPVICEDNRIREIIPQELLNCEDAITKAIDRLNEYYVETHWSDAGRIQPAEWSSNSEDPKWAGGTTFKDERIFRVKAEKKEVWKSLCRIGGTTGWYYANWLWKLRGLIDDLLGGVGLRRGRRHPIELRTGDALDFWRVQEIEDEEHLKLIAEMKLPGKAVLDFRLEKISETEVEIKQTALFLPYGLLGILYWYAVLPFHSFVFEGMLRGIIKATRKAKRFDYKKPLQLYLGSLVLNAHTVNLSETGTKIKTIEKFPDVKKIRIAFKDYDDFIDAKVRYRNETPNEYFLFLEFRKLNSEQKFWLREEIRKIG